MRRLRHKLAWLTALAALTVAWILPLCGDCGSCGSSCPVRDACHEAAAQLDAPTCCAPAGQLATSDVATQLAAKVLAPLPEVTTALPSIDSRPQFGRSSALRVSRTLDRCTLFSSFLI